MAVKGVFGSDSGITGDRKDDFASMLMQIHPTGTAKLLALSSGMESRDFRSIITTWFEENHLSGRISVTNNATTGITLTVDDASFAVPGVIYMIETTGEYVFVTAVTGNDLTVQRGFAGTTNTSIDGSSTPVPIQRISTAYEEGSAKPVSTANLGYPRFNYTEIFRNSWDATGTAQAVEFNTGNVVAKNRRDGLLFHSEDIERASWFGRKSIGVKNQQAFRTMDGIATQITTNVSSQSSDTSYTNIRDFLEGVFAKNIKGKPNERLAFCGNSVLGVVDTLAMTHGVMNLTPGATEIGFEVTKWRTPFGTISLVTHPLFNESPVWTKNLYVIHPGAIRFSWLRRTHEDQNDKDGTRAGADADFGVWTSELTVEYRAEVTGGKFTGIDTAKTDGL